MLEKSNCYFIFVFGGGGGGGYTIFFGLEFYEIQFQHKYNFIRNMYCRAFVYKTLEILNSIC